ncbi:hypothetical protein M5689_018795 [Euphorbia peplus]|nr:hypothetical protein M5689_018795 [Euphorbia peplus]
MDALHSSELLAERQKRAEVKATLETYRKEVEKEKQNLIPRMQSLLGYHVALTVERLHERGWKVPRDILNALNPFDEQSTRGAVDFLKQLTPSQK